MPKWLQTRRVHVHTMAALAVMLIMAGGFFAFSWVAGTIAVLITAAIGFYMYQLEQKQREEMAAYIATISHRVKKASVEVISEMPIGIVLYDDEKQVEWHNQYIANIMERDTLVGESALDLWPEIKHVKEKEAILDLAVGEQIFKVKVLPDERLMYFIDNTAYATLAEKYESEKIVFGFIALDNVDEVTQGMDDQERSVTLAAVTTVINEWAVRNNLYLRRTSSDRFLLIMNQKDLTRLEENRFDILDEVKEATDHLKIPVTISIGIAAGGADLVENGQMAQSSLDIALARGGDQVAVKVNDRVSFYGGKTDALEKRTRVRARVVSHALRNLIKESDRVVIMGHKVPDMDAVGAAIGVATAAEWFGKDAYIVLEGINPSIERMMEMIYEDDELARKFISPEDAYRLITERTLAVVVDTHKQSFVAEPKLLDLTPRLFVVDHHRRGEEFLSNATLIYMEPYASSTCELVTELLQYIHDRIAIGSLEATAMLAGIVTDTKSFYVRTGARTFEAASFLRRNGADSSLIQWLMKDDLQGYLRKADIIRNTQIIRGRYAVAVAESGQQYPQLLIAQVADTLLNMRGIAASFVISERPDGLIGISARSSGQINVQVIMERMGGGGHLTNAAVQLEGTTAEAAERLLALLHEYDEKEGLSE